MSPLRIVLPASRTGRRGPSSRPGKRGWPPEASGVGIAPAGGGEGQVCRRLCHRGPSELLRLPPLLLLLLLVGAAAAGHREHKEGCRATRVGRRRRGWIGRRCGRR